MARFPKPSHPTDCSAFRPLFHPLKRGGAYPQFSGNGTFVLFLGYAISMRLSLTVHYFNPHGERQRY